MSRNCVLAAYEIQPCTAPPEHEPVPCKDESLEVQKVYVPFSEEEKREKERCYGDEFEFDSFAAPHVPLRVGRVSRPKTSKTKQPFTRRKYS